jgi:hypothetical protein
MRHTVIWTPTAEDDLAALWIAATDRQAVTVAADTIDALLRTDPTTRGESRFDTVRMLRVPPLGVDFEVVDDDRIVYVLSVWRTT